MALPIKWTPSAERTLRKVLIYLTEHWGDKSADDFSLRLFSTIDLMAEFPEIGLVENAKKEIRSLSIVSQINVFYRFDHSGLYILGLFDNRMHPSKKKKYQ